MLGGPRKPRRKQASGLGILGGWRLPRALECATHLPVTHAPHLPGSLLMTPPRLTDRHSQQQPLGTHRQGSPPPPRP